jgi:hypothetical protein
VLEALTGTGLAASAGLNAYIPLVTMGVLARYTDVIDLPTGWDWLSNGWTLTILAVLLAVEVVADKVPVVDHVNDVVQTVVRPTAGGLAFGAGSSSETVTVSDPGSFFSSNQWVPIAAGVVIALFVHGVKSASRPVVNVTTAGMGAPVDWLCWPGRRSGCCAAGDAGGEKTGRCRVPAPATRLVDCSGARPRHPRLRPDVVGRLLSARP